MCAARLGVDTWDVQYTAVSGKLKSPGGRVDLKQMRKVDTASRS